LRPFARSEKTLPSFRRISLSSFRASANSFAGFWPQSPFVKGFALILGAQREAAPEIREIADKNLTPIKIPIFVGPGRT
jgi:hypothetical protein